MERKCPRRTTCLSIALAACLLAMPESADAGAPPGQYTLSATTVLDLKTGLIWQRAVDPGSYNWVAALAYCEGLTLDSKSDWRLPSLHELESIVDDSTHDPAIDLVAFPETPVDQFWSSSPFAPFPNSNGYAWSVWFKDGSSTNFGGVSFPGRVRCVR